MTTRGEWIKQHSHFHPVEPGVRDGLFFKKECSPSAGFYEIMTSACQEKKA